eukprot:scaffold93357_cov35-Attheya_sp.AAC.1
MEADFNFANKLQFGCRLVKEAAKRGKFTKMWMEVGNIVRQLKLVRTLNSCATFTDKNDFQEPMHQLTHPSTTTAWYTPSYHSCATYGDSKSHYGGKQQIPFQGTCQGNGAGPAIWLVVVSGILQHLETEGHGLDFQSAITVAATTIIAFCYVDDTSLVVTAKDHNEDVIDMIHRLQEAINCWSGGLSTTGGALKQIKCFWSVCYFIWKNGEPEYATIEDAPELQLTIPVHDGEPAVIERVDVHEAKEMLGLWQSVSGNTMETQFDILQEKLTAWMDLLKTGHLSRNLAWRAFRGTIWKTVDYVLPATTFTEAQCDALIKPVYREILPNLGANRNFPNAYRCAPNKYYGLALPHPYVEQGIHEIHYLLMHGIAFTETGNLFCTSIEEMQLEIGVQHPFISYSFNVYGQLATEGLCYT